MNYKFSKLYKNVKNVTLEDIKTINNELETLLSEYKVAIQLSEENIPDTFGSFLAHIKDENSSYEMRNVEEFSTLLNNLSNRKIQYIQIESAAKWNGKGISINLSFNNIYNSEFINDAVIFSIDISHYPDALEIADRFIEPFENIFKEIPLTKTQKFLKSTFIPLSLLPVLSALIWTIISGNFVDNYSSIFLYNIAFDLISYVISMGILLYATNKVKKW